MSIAPDPKSPRIASPRFGELTGAGVGLGVGVGGGVGVGEVDVAGATLCDGAGVNRWKNVRAGVFVGVGFGVAVRTGVGVTQFRPAMHAGVAVAGGVSDGDGVQNGGHWARAGTPETRANATTMSARNARRRAIYISTTRCVSVDRTPGSSWIVSNTTSARCLSSAYSQYAKMSGCPQQV
jgi:hypothetical protein